MPSAMFETNVPEPWRMSARPRDSSGRMTVVAGIRSFVEDHERITGFAVTGRIRLHSTDTADTEPAQNVAFRTNPRPADGKCAA